MRTYLILLAVCIICFAGCKKDGGMPVQTDQIRPVIIPVDTGIIGMWKCTQVDLNYLGSCASNVFYFDPNPYTNDGPDHSYISLNYGHTFNTNIITYTPTFFRFNNDNTFSFGDSANFQVLCTGTYIKSQNNLILY